MEYVVKRSDYTDVYVLNHFYKNGIWHTPEGKGKQSARTWTFDEAKAVATQLNTYYKRDVFVVEKA